VGVHPTLAQLERYRPTAGCAGVLGPAPCPHSERAALPSE
jgi:hypothetical protein